MGRVLCDTATVICGIVSNKALTRLVFPAPEGAETMNTDGSLIRCSEADSIVQREGRAKKGVCSLCVCWAYKKTTSAASPPIVPAESRN